MTDKTMSLREEVARGIFEERRRWGWPESPVKEGPKAIDLIFADAAIAIVLERAAGVCEVRKRIYQERASKADAFAEATDNAYDFFQYAAEVVDRDIQAIRSLSDTQSHIEGEA